MSDSRAPDLAAWLRGAITERLELARAATQVPWEPEGDDPTDDEVWIDADGQEWRHVVCRGPQSHENMLHIAANDPRDTIARCEAELDILDEHPATDWEAYGERMCVRCVNPYDPEGDELHRWVAYPCPTVRAALGAYKHWPGYQEEWSA